MSELFEHGGALGEGVRGPVVNRTHRVIRERAKNMAARRSRVRSLWIPVAVWSALLLIICTALWSQLDQYDATPTGTPDASNQFLVLGLWFLPLSLALLTVVFVRRSKRTAENEASK
jgi:hypothetical protein